VKNVICNIGFPKLEPELYMLKKHKISQCLAYTSIKVKSLIVCFCLSFFFYKGITC
jgi:hypothetical protein